MQILSCTFTVSRNLSLTFQTLCLTYDHFVSCLYCTGGFDGFDILDTDKCELSNEGQLPLLPLGTKDRLSESLYFQTGAKSSKTLDAKEGIRRYRWYVCVQVHLRGRVRQSMVQCMVDRGETESSREMKKQEARRVEQQQAQILILFLFMSSPVPPTLF